MNRTSNVLRLVGTTLGSLVLAVGATAALAGCGEGGGEMTVLTVEPQNGPTQGEQPVKIGGQNFRTDIGYTVFFGTRRSPSVTIIDPETLLVTTPQVEEPGTVDITIRADNGDAFRISDVFEFQEAGGGMVNQFGETTTSMEGGNLAY